MENMLSIMIPRDELARNLGGGLPLNSLILMEGKDGTGKSIISQRLLYSFLQNDHTVTYISTELNTPGFLEQMASLDYDIKYNLLNEQLLFIPMFPFLGNVQLKKNFLDRLLATEKLFSSQVIIIDTFSFLLLKDDITEEKIFNIIKTFRRLSTLNKIIIFCIDPDHLNERFLTLLRAVADIYIKLEIRSFAGEQVRVLNILRFKKPKDQYLSQIPFKIEPGKGLAIEIASFT